MGTCAERKLTDKEVQNLYFKGEDQKIVEELFGENHNNFNLASFKEKSGWDNESLNPINELIGLADFLGAAVEGHNLEDTKRIFTEVVENFVMA